jgi:hypothetical protein
MKNLRLASALFLAGVLSADAQIVPPGSTKSADEEQAVPAVLARLSMDGTHTMPTKSSLVSGIKEKRQCGPNLRASMPDLYATATRTTLSRKYGS